MAHAGTTLDLGRSRQTTKQNRFGWFKAPLAVALAIMLGVAAGTGAWTVLHTQAAISTSNMAASAAAHERIEAHQALIATQVDRSTDAIESHRTAVANVAVSPRDERLEMINQFETITGTSAAPRDDRGESIRAFEGITGFAGIVRPYPVYDPQREHNRAYGIGEFAPFYPAYDPKMEHASAAPGR